MVPNAAAIIPGCSSGCSPSSSNRRTRSGPVRTRLRWSRRAHPDRHRRGPSGAQLRRSPARAIHRLPPRRAARPAPETAWTPLDCALGITRAGIVRCAASAHKATQPIASMNATSFMPDPAFGIRPSSTPKSSPGHDTRRSRTVPALYPVEVPSPFTIFCDAARPLRTPPSRRRGRVAVSAASTNRPLASLDVPAASIGRVDRDLTSRHTRSHRSSLWRASGACVSGRARVVDELDPVPRKRLGPSIRVLLRSAGI